MRVNKDAHDRQEVTGNKEVVGNDFNFGRRGNEDLVSLAEKALESFECFDTTKFKASESDKN